jgi:hypothetical protein
VTAYPFAMLRRSIGAFALSCWAWLLLGAAFSQGPVVSPPIPGQRPPSPAGAIVPPGFSVEIQAQPIPAPNPGIAGSYQADPAASATFEPATARIGFPVEYRVTVAAGSA